MVDFGFWLALHVGKRLALLWWQCSMIFLTYVGLLLPMLLSVLPNSQTQSNQPNKARWS